MPWAPDYVTTAELRSFLRDQLVTEDENELGFAVTAASRAIDDSTHRQFGNVAAAEERHYKPMWNRRRARWVVEIDDLMDDTGLDIQVDDGTVDLFTLEPVNADDKARPWTHVVIDPDAAAKPSTVTEYEVAVTALWGWSSVPDTIKEATLLQASRFFARRFSPYGVAGSPETGSELRLLSRVDPDVMVAIKSYVRNRARVG